MNSSDQQLFERLAQYGRTATLLAGIFLAALLPLHLTGQDALANAPLFPALHLLLWLTASVFSVASLTAFCVTMRWNGLFFTTATVVVSVCFVAFASTPSLYSISQLGTFIASIWTQSGLFEGGLQYSAAYYPGLPILGEYSLQVMEFDGWRSLYLLGGFLQALAMILLMRPVSSEAKLFMLSIILGSPLVCFISAYSPDALFTCLYATCALGALLRFLYRSGGRWEGILCGVAAGLALCSSYGALPLLLAMLACAYLPGVLRTVSLGRALFLPVIALPLTLLLSVPWYLKNALTTSNPFFPLGSDLINRGVEGAVALRHIDTRSLPVFLEGTGREVSTALPLAIQAMFGVVPPEQVSIYQESLQPFLCSAFLCLFWKRSERGKFALLVSLVAVLAYALLSPLDSYFLAPVTFILALGAGSGLASLCQSIRIPLAQRAAPGMVSGVILFLGLFPLFSLIRETEALRVSLGKAPKQELLEILLPHKRLLKNTPEPFSDDALVFMLNGQVGFNHLSVKSISEGNRSPSFLKGLLSRQTSAADTFRDLGHLQVTHLLADEPRLLQSMSEELSEKWNELKEYGLREIGRDGNLTLWQLAKQ